MNAVPVAWALNAVPRPWARGYVGVDVVGPQIAGEADGEFVARAEDLDAGVAQPQGVGDRRRPEVAPRSAGAV